MKINFTLSPKETKAMLNIIGKDISNVSDVHLDHKSGTIDTIVVEDGVTIFMNCKENFVIDLYTKIANSSKVIEAIKVLISPIIEDWKKFFNDWREPKYSFSEQLKKDYAYAILTKSADILVAEDLDALKRLITTMDPMDLLKVEDVVDVRAGESVDINVLFSKGDEMIRPIEYDNE